MARKIAPAKDRIKYMLGFPLPAIVKPRVTNSTKNAELNMRIKSTGPAAIYCGEYRKATNGVEVAAMTAVTGDKPIKR